MCELCELKIKTNVYIDNEYFIILDCKDCKIPMIVWKEHTMSVPEPDEQVMEGFLIECGRQFYGYNSSFFIDKTQGKVFDHIHWHVRNKERDRG